MKWEDLTRQDKIEILNLIEFKERLKEKRRRNNMLNERKMKLIEMDRHIRTTVDEEWIITDVWLAGGLPDGYDHYDLMEVAEDDEMYGDVVRCYHHCLKFAGLEV